jgi:hypothetical protein
MSESTPRRTATATLFVPMMARAMSITSGGAIPQACVCACVKASRCAPRAIPLALRVPRLLPIRPLRHCAVCTACGCHGPLPWSGLHTLLAREPDAIAAASDGNITR